MILPVGSKADRSVRPLTSYTPVCLMVSELPLAPSKAQERGRTTSVPFGEGLGPGKAAQKTRCQSVESMNQTGAEGKASLKTSAPTRDGWRLSFPAARGGREALSRACVSPGAAAPGEAGVQGQVLGG